MGTEVFYCSRCQIRLFGHQFLEGTAVRVGKQIACSDCLGEIIAPLPLREQEDILLRLEQVKSGAGPAAVAPEDEFFELDDSHEAPSAPAGDDFFELDTPEKRRSSASSATGLRPAVAASSPGGAGQTVGLLFFIGMVVLLGVLGGMVYFFGSKPAPPDAAYRPPSRPVESAPSEGVRRVAPASAPATREGVAREELEKARQFAKDHPRDLVGQQDRFRKALSATEGTPIAEEARKEIASLRDRQKEILAAELEPVDKDVKAAVEKEEYQRATDLLDAARKKFPFADWSTLIDTRIRDVGVSAWKVFAPLRDKALEAHGRKADAEVRAAKDRVAKWGMPNFVRELDRSLASGTAAPTAPVATPTPPPDTRPVSEESRAYQTPWAAALAAAALRDYDAAITLLNRAASGAKDDALKTEIQADLEILRSVQAVQRGALQVLAAWPKGEKVALEFLDENLAPSRITEPFVRADADVVEVLAGGSAQPVDTADLTPRSLAHLFRTRSGARNESDARPAALLCLIEGDSDGARSNLAGPADRIPWKYWSHAARIQEARSGASDATRHEIAARKLWFSAEREYREVKTRGAAIQSYRQLLNEFADSALVKRRRAQIAARRDGAKDWVFLADDLGVRGTLKSSKQPKVGDCWVSVADTADPVKSAENFAELGFYAFQDVQYRCWVYVAGCCNEVFSFYYQASGLPYVVPETKESVVVEPGGSMALPVKHSITFLKKSHEDHTGPKEPKRWEWVELKLPKYAQAGLKTIRAITDQKGFGIAYAVVSSTRQGPPGDSEVRGWHRKAETEDVPAAAVPATAVAPTGPPPDVREGLLGQWKFEESTRATALDSSGNDFTGVFTNEPARVQGRFGQGLGLDGKDRHVVLPNSTSLDDLQEGSYSAACWYKPNVQPAGKGEANDAAHALIVKSSLHEGLTYASDGRFIMDHWIAGNTSVGATSAQAFPPGSWYHVAGVVNRPTGTVQIFVNGRLESTVAYAGGTAAREFDKEPWKIGMANPGGATLRFAADGIFDDVRLYTRALTLNEIRTLAGVTGPSPTIALTSPTGSESFEPGAAIAFAAQVTSPDKVAKVEFLVGGAVVGSDAAPPFAYTWSKVPAGSYSVQARLTDKTGNTALTPTVTVKVGSVTFYRAFNLGGAAVTVDGTSFEGKGAKGLTTNGTPLDLKVTAFAPPAEGPRAQLLKTALVHTQGTSVSVIGIPNGSYQLYLTVVEDGPPQTYDLHAEGKPVQPKVKGGPAGSWARLGPWTVDVTDGLLDVEAKGGTANFAALEIWKVGR